MTIAQIDLNNDSYNATYCPEDNKLRLYCGRVERETYDHLRKNGWTATPKQSCDFVATWSPDAEDIALSMIGESDDIGDEDYSPEDRAADRAERFAGYRDKRRSEAGAHADNLTCDPVGFQSAAKAARFDRLQSRTRRNALGQWSKAEYWQTRTAGVIGHALHKSSPSARRGRILTIESEQRKLQARADEVRARFEQWCAIYMAADADEVTPLGDDGYTDQKQCTATQIRAYMLAGDGRQTATFNHPDAETAEAIAAKTDARPSLYDLLCRDTFYGVPIRRLTPREAARLYIGGRSQALSPDGNLNRWLHHFELRLAYERQMLANEGGSVADIEIVPGGWFGKYQVAKVHKSPATKKVVSVSLILDPTQPGKHRRGNIQRLGEDAYRAPTAEELAEFHATQSASKKAAKAAAPAKPQLINPTDADAERLQAILNAKRGKGFAADDAGKVARLTQASYSGNSGGSYSPCETVEITERLEKYHPSYFHGENNYGQRPVFKVRMFRDRVVVLTDKPQKPLPFELCAEIEASKPSLLEAVRLIPVFQAGAKGAYKENMTDEAAKAFDAMRYHGLGYSSSQCQWGLTDSGHRWAAVLKMLDGDMLAGQRLGLIDADGNPKPRALELARELEPGLICLDADGGKLYDGLAVAAARSAN
jgi:hypothetical protein